MIQATAQSAYVHFLFVDKDYREPELATSMGCGTFLSVIRCQIFLEVKTVMIKKRPHELWPKI